MDTVPRPQSFNCNNFKSSKNEKAKDQPRKPQNKPSHKQAQPKPEDFEKKLNNFLKDSEDKLTSIKRQTESRRGGRGARR